MPRKKGRRRERARKRGDRKKAGVISLETRSVKRNTRTRVANNETKGERRKKRKKKREKKKEALENPGEKEDVDTIQWRLQVFPVFPRGGGE